MRFNHSKLRGKIKEFGYRQEDIAEKIGINKGTMSAKLNNTSAFTTEEIDDICRLLDISKHEIGVYFFTE